MVADLLEAHEEGENHPFALHALDVLELAREIVGGLRVHRERGLLGTWVLGCMGFAEHKAPPRRGREPRRASKTAVAGDHEIDAGEVVRAVQLELLARRRRWMSCDRRGARREPRD